MGFLMPSAKVPPPPPPAPPPPAPPTMADATVGQAGSAARAAAAAAAGQGFDNTLLTSGAGTPGPATAEKKLTGSTILLIASASSVLASWLAAGTLI